MDDSVMMVHLSEFKVRNRYWWISIINLIIIDRWWYLKYRWYECKINDSNIIPFFYIISQTLEPSPFDCSLVIWKRSLWTSRWFDLWIESIEWIWNESIEETLQCFCWIENRSCQLIGVDWILSPISIHPFIV